MTRLLVLALLALVLAGCAKETSDKPAETPKPQARRAPCRYWASGGGVEGGEPRGGRHAVRVPAAEGVVLVEHRRELRGRAVQAGRRAVGDRLPPHPPRQSGRAHGR